MRRFFATIFVSLISVSIIVQFTSCIDDKKDLDLVYISKANVFVSKDDIKEGIRKTLNTMPLVIFSHDKHENKKIPCIDCHHKKNNDSRQKKCVSCHKGIQGTEALHGFCIPCHEKKKEGPKTCEDCHKEEIRQTVSRELKKEYKSDGIYDDPFHPVHEKNKITCIECHHKEKSATEKMKKCSACHAGEPRLRIIHIFCKECHDNSKKAPVACKGCHKK